MLGIVVVVYKSFNQTIRFIKNEIPKITVPSKTVIINNASTQEEGIKLAEACGASLVLTEQPINRDNNLFVISSEDNLGYSKGNNLGARFLNDNFFIEHFLFSNDDIEITSNNVVVKLIERLDEAEKIGMIGPRVIGPDGADQSPHFEVSFTRYFAWNAFPFLRGKFQLLQKKNVYAYKEPVEGFCHWVSGCFFIVRTSTFLSAGMFDVHTFLYGEEKILAERLLHLGHKAFFDPSVTVHHLSGGTTSKHLKSDWIKEEVFQNDCYYYAKYKFINPKWIRILAVIRRLTIL